MSANVPGSTSMRDGARRVATAITALLLVLVIAVALAALIQPASPGRRSRGGRTCPLTEGTTDAASDHSVRR